MVKKIFVFVICFLGLFQMHPAFCGQSQAIPEKIRQPVALRTLYPDSSEALSRKVLELLDTAQRQKRPFEQGLPKAIVVPEEGLYVSGDVAATAFASLKPLRPFVTRVVLIGTSGRERKYGISLCDEAYWQMPNQRFEVDRDFMKKRLKIQGVGFDNEIHQVKSNLEVQLPFVSEVFEKDVKIVPILIEEASLEQVIDIIDAVWGGPETVLIFSSNLSSYKSEEAVLKTDAKTKNILENQEEKALKKHQTSSHLALLGLLTYAKENNLEIKNLDLSTSNETLPIKNKVIGFGAFGVYEDLENESEIQEILETLWFENQEKLLRIAAQSIMTGFEKGRPLIVSPWLYPEAFQEKGATFVNIYYQGALRGSAGSLEPTRSILEDISQNAYQAAFSDFRFLPLTKEEFLDAEVSVSILTKPSRIRFENQEDLFKQFKSKRDGVILRERANKAMFLPQIWETFQTPKEFFSRLKQKAGLPSDYWSETLKAYRFEILDAHSKNLENPASVWLKK